MVCFCFCFFGHVMLPMPFKSSFEPQPINAYPVKSYVSLLNCSRHVTVHSCIKSSNHKSTHTLRRSSKPQAVNAEVGNLSRVVSSTTLLTSTALPEMPFNSTNNASRTLEDRNRGGLCLRSVPRYTASEIPS